ncbi:DNA repair protein recA homolog 2, mitochondrial-like isoform X1 [Dendrobium catenatum]|uniref:DNA repair protein recA homolog 2, mitochondrial-like isoform X1 n=1 Tax=Dendrobium catenatum TaxID=906689 RepID=UPI0009F62A0E|nr:DNA repair protein recA homolog 2, mitochondrial-like isoform X1 [Dendrobium catenatum]
MRVLTPLYGVSSHLLRVVFLNVPAFKRSALASLCSNLQHTEGEYASSFRMNGRCLSSSLVVDSVLEYERDQQWDVGKVEEKNATLHLALSQLVVDFDRDSNLSMRRFFSTRWAPVIPTGSLKLDQALGIGGLPKGRIVEIYGREASGKTTLALHIVKEAQKLGGYCAYLAVENLIDPSLVEAMGVDTENLLVARPNSAENTLSIVNTLVNSRSVDVIVVDSVAALVPECELLGMIDSKSVDMQSQLMTQALRKIQHSLCLSQALVIFVNQVRMKSSKGFDEANEVTCGGNALKFYAAVRMRITRKELLHCQDKITGIGISIEIIKNKMAPALKKVDLEIEFGRGFRSEAEILAMALDHGIIIRKGGGYWIKRKFFKHKQEVECFLAENSDVTEELVNRLKNQLFEKEQKMAESAEHVSCS